MIRRLTLIGFAAAFFCATMGAQTIHDWASLGHTPAIAAGIRIEIGTAGNNRLRGQFKSADDEGLVMTTASGEQRIARATILRVSVKSPGHRLRHMLIGLGIGAAGGLTLGAVADARCTGNCIEGKTPLGKEVGTGLGALIGTIIGVALPAGGWREVYRAP
jgi:hypothetical protein